MTPTFCYGDSVEVRRPSCTKWVRGIVKAGRYGPETFLVQFDHGEQSWHPRNRMRHCVTAPKAET